jgi:predicted permease
LARQAVLFATHFALEHARSSFGTSARGYDRGALLRDVRVSVRGFRRRPLLAATVVATLGVGIGANAAVFSMLRTVVLAPLPYPHAERLVALEPTGWAPEGIVARLGTSGRSLDAVAAYYPHRFRLTSSEGPAEVEGAVVTHGVLELLGARPTLGRSFSATDESAEAPEAAVISRRLWRERFGGEPDVLGRTVRLDGRPHVLVGVLDPDFRQITPQIDDPDVWTVAALDRLGAHILREGADPWAIPIARLAPGVAARDADRELAAAAEGHRALLPADADEPEWQYAWTGLHAQMVGDARRPLLLLQGAVALLLLLSCVNVANLLLVHLETRRTELAVRAALGASRGRLTGQLLVDGMLLSLLGAAAGLALVAVSLDAMVAAAPPGIPLMEGVALDRPATLFALGVALATGLVFGVGPGLIVTRRGPGASVAGGGRGTASHARSDVSNGLIVAQVALTFVLVAGAGLLARSLMMLTTRDPGFRTEGVMAVSLTASRERYATADGLARYQERLIESLESVPGAASVAVANNLPLSRGSATRTYLVEGREEEERTAQYGVVSPGYFSTLGIPILRGRAFEPADGSEAALVVIVDQTLADRVWPGVDPLGRGIRFYGDDRWRTVVGVSGPVLGRGLAGGAAPGLYIPFGQRPATAVEVDVGRRMVLLVHGTAGAALDATSLRTAVQAVEAEQTVPSIRALRDAAAPDVDGPRFRAILLTAFAVIALLLAGTGVYGVVGTLVGRRTREIGLRRALGAGRGAVAWEVAARAGRRAALGMVLGSLALAVTAPLVEPFLFGVRPLDPVVLGGAWIVLGALTVVACVAPVSRALRIEAAIALRAE